MKIQVSPNLQMSKEPFKHISIPNFLDNEDAESLLNELSNEDFYLEEHDLYTFMRTIDLEYTSNQIIQEFREEMLSEKIIKSIESLTDTKLKRNMIELHSLKLQNTHYLLPHDDRVQKRKIAFILNLTKDFGEDDGGHLELFNMNDKKEPVNIVKSIQPKFNQFNLFVVSEKSFHQIREVTGNKERISISGWYYEN